MILACRGFMIADRTGLAFQRASGRAPTCLHPGIRDVTGFHHAAAGPAAGGLAEHSGELPFGQRLAAFDADAVGSYRGLVDVLHYRLRRQRGVRPRRASRSFPGPRDSPLARLGPIWSGGPARANYRADGTVIRTAMPSVTSRGVRIPR